MSERAAIYIEMMPAGNALEIAAIHSETGREVRFVVPAGTSEHDIKQLAQAKMDYVMRKDAEKQAEEKNKKPPGDGRGGIIV
jgi:predicted metal-dependent hydrolase